MTASRSAPSRAASADDLRALRIGDNVEVGSQRRQIRGRLDFEEYGVRWTEFVLDPDDRVWLSVEDVDDGADLEVSWWCGVGTAEVERGGPGDDVVVSGGASYHVQHRGEASYVARGQTGTPAHGVCVYADYRTPERLLLGWENYGDGWLTAVGRLIAPDEVGLPRE